LTYSEIIKLNREKNKGTFMDRSWKEFATNPLDDENLTKWDKFKQGGYSLKNVTSKFASNLSI
jgi:hypothetical protein